MTHLEFITAWLGSKSELEVSAKTGFDTRYIASTGVRLRQRGVLLPRLGTPGRKGGPGRTRFTDKLDVEAANKLILER